MGGGEGAFGGGGGGGICPVCVYGGEGGGDAQISERLARLSKLGLFCILRATYIFDADHTGTTNAKG